jgi:hypothetical protein
MLNGVAGRRFGGGSNTIFLPASGSSSYRTGDSGFYWSGTPNSATKGYYLFFYLTRMVKLDNDGNRGVGFTVRCVKK